MAEAGHSPAAAQGVTSGLTARARPADTAPMLSSPATFIIMMTTIQTAARGLDG
jgi:hypothetical protein